MFMAEFIDLQFNQHMAFKDAVVKDQIDKVVSIPDKDTFLASLETIT